LAQPAIYFRVGVGIFGARLSMSRILLMMGALVVAVLAFSALGLLAAALLMQTKRAGLMVSVVGSAFTLLGGVTYPVAVLPSWLQGLAALLPITYGLDAVRASLLPTLDLRRIAQDVAALSLFVAVLVPLAMTAFNWSTNRARREGSISHY